MIKRGIIYTENTTNLVDFARFLTDFGWTLFSADKTEEILKKEEIPVTREQALSCNSNFYLHDTSTLVKKLLSTKNEDTTDYSNRYNPDDGYSLICINVVPNMIMYPNKEQVNETLHSPNYRITTILRDACINYKNLIILTDPADYDEVMIQLRTDHVTEDFRAYLAAKALNLISAFDSGISSTVLMTSSIRRGQFMNYLMFPFTKQQVLTEGANPQQNACLYKYPTEMGAINGFSKSDGIKADYNIISDVSNAWEIISSIYSNLKNQYSVQSTTCDGYKYTTQFTPLTGTVFTIAIKYKSVLGAAISTNVLDSFKNTYQYDTGSIEGETFGSSAVIDENAAKELLKCNFAAIVAPGFTSEAKDLLAHNSSTLLISTVKNATSPFDMQLLNGGLIFQTKDSIIFDQWNVKTKNRPSQNISDQMVFGILLAMGSRTHCAILVKDHAIAGISQCCKSSAKAIAHVLDEGKETAARLNQAHNPDYKIADILVCDTSAPLTDSVKELIDRGVSAIIQTGGSKNDEEFIKYCDDHGVSMIYTGMSHISY